MFGVIKKNIPSETDNMNLTPVPSGMTKSLSAILGGVIAIITAIINFSKTNGGIDLNNLSHLFLIPGLGVAGASSSAYGVWSAYKSHKEALKSTPPVDPKGDGSSMIRIEHPGISISIALDANALKNDPLGEKLAGLVSSSILLKAATTTNVEK